MKLQVTVSALTLCWGILTNSAWAYDLATGDCSGLGEWKRQHYYLPGEEVQYLGNAYENSSGEGSKRDRPDEGPPWALLGPCVSTGSGEGGGGSTGGGGDFQPISIYGAWHCSDDYCTWSNPRSIAEFDLQNHWLIDRGDSADCAYPGFLSCNPSVNLVVLSFVHPLRLLHDTHITEGGLCEPCGIPPGMTEELVNYFKSQGIRVMLSIGGITYVDPWNQALAEDPVQLGLNAAAVATTLTVGIEIDYEENRNPNLDGLQQFIEAYRSVHPYDPTGTDHPARLTIDLAAGDRWLVALTEYATREWLNTDDPTTPDPVLDYANAMVTARPESADSAIAHWQEHVDGKPQYDPPIPPLAPAKFTGSLWLTGRNPVPECVDFGNSLQHPTATGNYVQSVAPSGAGTTAGMLGFMFWAAECQGTRSKCTTPEFNNSCEGGMGAAAGAYPIPVPMPALRQE